MTRRVARVCAFIQGRMSSRRFPGKILAPFRGTPLIAGLAATVRAAVGPDVPVVVLTSTESSDDPVATYLQSIGQPVFRGPLDDVLARFQLATLEWPSEWVLRVNADSPLIDPAVIRAVLRRVDDEADLITTIFPRTFPKGQNVEAIRRQTLLSVDSSQVEVADREHVTRHFYRHPERYRIANVESGDASLAELDMSVDTVDDLNQLEALSSDPLAGRLARLK